MPGRSAFDVAPQLMFGRFQVLEELGSGLQGSVVRAFDTFTRGEVALKILHLQQSAQALVRFKTEFRTLAGLVHPNLVRLGELFERDHVWAFSMELVRGGDLLSWVRTSETGFSEPRLRAGLTQTVSALTALHRARLIHRDIKPENVRVTPDGRVVVVDFGMVAEHGPSARTASQHLVGTVGYIAPEVINGELATEKSDLYGLGAMLYQSLTGVLPYDGTLFQVAIAQRAGPPLRPAELCAQVPAELDALCMALLANEPDKRPTSEQIEATLCRGSSPSNYPASDARPEIFVGRAAELRALQDKFQERDKPGLRSMIVRGESGIGKSALVASFIRQVRRGTPDCVVLSGRCHPREHVSYNAFDDLFDELSRLLARLSEEVRRSVLSPNAALLPALSPHFAKVPGIAGARTSQAFAEIERAHLFDAFVDLLANLARALSLLITIDDVHWADSDSMQLLKSMLDRHNELGLCLIATSRCQLQEAEIPSLVFELLADARFESLLLEPLDEKTAEQLATQILPSGASEGALATLTHEAAGSPIFLIELALAHSAQRSGTEAQVQAHSAATSLDAALRTRIAALPTNARAVSEALAVAGAPVSMGVLMAALAISIEDLYGILTLLRRERLTCETTSGELMIYHDRVRQAIVAELSAAQLEHVHGALASAFELKSFFNPLRAAQHWLLARNEERAAARIEEAAARALETAVFEQAAELYRRRLELRQVPLSDEAQRALQIKLARALAAAGHCSQSAHVLLVALSGAKPELRRELSLRAAQQLLQAGELEEGMEVAALALREVDLPWRANSGTALFHLAIERLQIRAAQVSYLRPRRADGSQVERQLDTMLQLAHPLAWSDISRSMELSARGLLLAMRERRSDYLPMLLAAEAVQATMRDPDSETGGLLLADAKGWLTREGAGRERAYCKWAEGATTLLKTKYAEADSLLGEAEQLYRVECPDEAWMRVNVRGLLLNAQLGVGKHAEFVAAGELWTREAQAKGDAYARAYYSVGGQAALRHMIAADAPEAALAEIELVMQPWQASWGLHKLLRVKCVHDVLSYLGGDQAYTWWQREARVPPLTPAFFAEGFAWRRADATLRAGIERSDPGLVRLADRMLKPLARAVTPYVRVFSGLTAMQIAVLDQRKADGRRIARAIESDLAAQDDFRTFVYQPLLSALSAPQSAHTALWRSLHGWFVDRGWKNPEKALAWVLPIATLR